MTRIKRPLFGGAIQAFLPDEAIDARQDKNKSQQIQKIFSENKYGK